MKLLNFYTIRASRPLDVDLPLVLTLEGLELTLREAADSECNYSLQISGPVDPTAIQPVLEEVDCGTRTVTKTRGLKVAEESEFRSAGRFFCRLLSFAYQDPLARFAGTANRIEPESPEDEELLVHLGTTHLLSGTRLGPVDVLQVHQVSTDDRTLSLFREREIGLALYSDALRVHEPVAKFRELWRVLESAFRSKNAKLVKALERFAPLSEMGCDATEIDSLLTLRGRASHAEGKAGLKEYDFVSSQTAEHNPRLRAIVERVILTKKRWGSPDCETEVIGKGKDKE